MSPSNDPRRYSSFALGLLGSLLFLLTACQGDPLQIATGDAPGTTPDSLALTTSAPEVTIPPTLSYSGNLSYEVVATIPHDVNAFTQGLEFVGDRLLESTGRRGESVRQWLDPTTGEVTELEPLATDLFGEGITEVDGLLYQLTYTSGRVIVSDADTLDPIQEFTYDGQGWGLCSNDSGLVMTNGNPSLFFRDPETFALTKTVDVTLNGEPLANLNELECVGDQVWSNVWQNNSVVVINPETGAVEAALDLTALVPQEVLTVSGAVLNGIAYRATTDTFFVTGKLWPVLYEIRITS